MIVGVSIPWENKTEARAKSFWAAEEMPEFQGDVKKPESLVPRSVRWCMPGRTDFYGFSVFSLFRCPMTGKRLRLKDLVPVKFELANNAKGKDTEYSVSLRGQRWDTHVVVVGYVLLCCVEEAYHSSEMCIIAALWRGHYRESVVIGEVASAGIARSGSTSWCGIRLSPGVRLLVRSWI